MWGAWQKAKRWLGGGGELGDEKREKRERERDGVVPGCTSLVCYDFE